MTQAKNVLADAVSLLILNHMPSTNIRIDQSTRRAIESLAQELQVTKAETVRLAIRRLQQARMGAALSRPVTSSESSWLGAELG
jgi:hypothetical protein